MSLAVLTRRTWSLFEAVGGWRTVADGVASRLVFLVAYLLTGEVVVAALVAVGGVVVLALLRAVTGGRFWQSAVGLVVVGGSALFASTTGNAVDFYLSTVLMQLGGGAVFLGSMLVGWPIVGVVVGAGTDWRRDRALRRRYQLCSAMFVAKSVLAVAVLVPLYLADQVVALGLAAATLAGAPGTALWFYLCWRTLNGGSRPGTAAARARPARRPCGPTPPPGSGRR
ncbi:DUF3159 domain-containing protein [Pseudonocardia sp. CA-107938]|uniref:DUF3159 domain-containing protein n=1 Tax=Pseudonocardia sp. CA-107938 TaxID=3240021 RepID=UPI003D8D7DBD